MELTTAQALALQRRMEEQQQSATEVAKHDAAAAAVVSAWAREQKELADRQEAVPAALEAAIGASQLTVSADEKSALTREARSQVEAGKAAEVAVAGALKAWGDRKKSALIERQIANDSPSRRRF